MTNKLVCSKGTMLVQEPRLYDTCGLPNIWLNNGFKLVTHGDHELMEVEDREGLHREIALWLVTRRNSLKGREVKFIRRAMDLTQAELGHHLSTSEQTVARWEKSKVQIPGPEARLLRITYLLSVLKPLEFAKVFEQMPRHLSEGSEGPEEAAHFHHLKRWKEAPLRRVA